MATCIAKTRVVERVNSSILLHQCTLLADWSHNDCIKTTILNSSVECHSLTALCEVLYLVDLSGCAVDECVDCSLRVSYYITLSKVVLQALNICAKLHIELSNNLLHIWRNGHTGVVHRYTILNSYTTWQYKAESTIEVTLEHCSALVLACTSQDTAYREGQNAILECTCDTLRVVLWVIVRRNHKLALRNGQTKVLLLDVALCSVYTVDNKVCSSMLETCILDSLLALDTECRNNHLSPRILNHIHAGNGVVLVDSYIDLSQYGLNLVESSECITTTELTKLSILSAHLSPREELEVYCKAAISIRSALLLICKKEADRVELILLHSCYILNLYLQVSLLLTCSKGCLVCNLEQILVLTCIREDVYIQRLVSNNTGQENLLNGISLSCNLQSCCILAGETHLRTIRYLARCVWVVGAGSEETRYQYNQQRIYHFKIFHTLIIPLYIIISTTEPFRPD